MGTIPNSVVVVVGEAVGLHYYNHRVLEDLFVGHGAPGDPPEGNCVEKCQRWLRRANEDPAVDACALLGAVLEDFMDRDLESEAMGRDEMWMKRRIQVEKALARVGISYQFGGRIIGPMSGGASRSLQSIFQQRDFGALDAELQRTLQTVQTDPPAALTAACALVESFCKTYIEDEHLDLPRDQTIKPLWKLVQHHLGLDPAQMEDNDMARILGGLTAIVDGLGSFRTHAGSAHGRGRKRYRVTPRHARLTANAAHTLVLFAIETWEVRKGRGAGASHDHVQRETGGSVPHRLTG